MGYETRAGSSPRMRGTVAPCVGIRGAQRFIPAHAGNSPFWCVCHWFTPVHPRACGEQKFPLASTNPNSGSSPRMRGTARHLITTSTKRRFIPAHAGNSWYGLRGIRKLPVHPRACGEQREHEAIYPGRYGSSPRMRGTEAKDDKELLHDRFIPAHAGNSV